MPLPSYAHGACSVPLLGETIGANLRRTVERFGDREALVVRHQDFRATYRELWELVGRAARGLLARGVKTGDRVGVWAPNRFEWVVIQYATARVGAILVNINPAYKAGELEYALNKSGVSLLCLARGFRQTDYLAILADVRDRCPQLRAALVLDSEWEALLAGGASVTDARLAEVESKLQFDDPINIQYTSGTTGFPKGATLSHHNILNNAHFAGARMLYTERDRVCVPVPFYHCFGMVLGNLCCASHGACVVVPSESFDPLGVLETVRAERCTSLYGVPTMFIAELDHPRFAEFDLSSLRTGIVAGAPCPVEVMKAMQTRMHMREVTNVCGMTETSPASTQTTTDDPLPKRVETVGRASPHAEIKIIDPATRRIVPRGTPGEQCSRGYMVMLGYWNDPDATAKAIDANGWMHTGDLAVMDDDGYVSIVGRIKDVIIRGGENISPREVEEFLHTIPGVVEAQVIGVPSPKYGEEVMAWVRPRAGVTLTADELRAACQGRIATFKIPRYWKFVDAFPLTVTGKVQKYRMREIATAELGAAPASST
ncbi:MAG: AMP-binding protein [Planctomycetes bacterium]|nr:AMP-binding protein [Planctomycetota bacterium]